MASDKKAYEMVEETSGSEHIPQGIPVQNLYAPQYIQPQNQMPVHPQQYHQGMMPPQFTHQQLPQFVGVSPQYISNAPQFMGNDPQFVPTDLNQMNPAHLASKRQEYEQEIQKHRFTVPFNWIMIAIEGVGAIGLIILFFYYYHIVLECGQYHSYKCQDFLGLPLLIAILSALICAASIYPHYKAILAYRKRDARSLTCPFIYFAFCLGFSILLMNLVCVAIYGYLAYASYKLKTAFAEVSRLDEHMSRQGVRNPSSGYLEQSYNQIQMATL